jgi:hypothetical protein
MKAFGCRFVKVPAILSDSRAGQGQFIRRLIVTSGARCLAGDTKQGFAGTDPVAVINRLNTRTNRAWEGTQGEKRYKRIDRRR